MGCKHTCQRRDAEEEEEKAPDVIQPRPLSLIQLPLPPLSPVSPVSPASQLTRTALQPPRPPQRPQRSLSLMDDKTPHREKSYSPNDRSLTFVDREDEHDFLYVGFSSRRALMSCGHSVTPESLTNWCQWQLDEGKSRFVCGMPSCNTVWTYEEVCKMALLTEDEKSSFEQQMFRNVAFKDLNAKICPGCRSHVVRNEHHNLCVECPQCTFDKRRDFSFCWQCLKEWKGPAPRSDHCENRGCANQALVTLRTCPAVTFSDVRGVSGCPSVRACPTCGLLVEHSGENCKNITCPDCTVEFCFVCLKITTECLRTSDYFIACSSGVAPRQTTIRYRHM